MRQQHLASLWIYAGRICLEAALARKSLADCHSHESRYVSFAAGWYAFCIEHRKCQTAGVLDCCEQVEAAEGESG